MDAPCDSYSRRGLEEIGSRRQPPLLEMGLQASGREQLRPKRPQTGQAPRADEAEEQERRPDIVPALGEGIEALAMNPVPDDADQHARRQPQGYEHREAQRDKRGERAVGAVH
jgi:hypothetical protein